MHQTPPNRNESVLPETPADGQVTESEHTQTETTIGNADALQTSTPNTSATATSAPGETTQLVNKAHSILRRGGAFVNVHSGFAHGQTSAMDNSLQQTLTNPLFTMQSYKPQQSIANTNATIRTTMSSLRSTIATAVSTITTTTQAITTAIASASTIFAPQRSANSSNTGTNTVHSRETQSVNHQNGSNTDAMQDLFTHLRVYSQNAYEQFNQSMQTMLMQEVARISNTNASIPPQQLNASIPPQQLNASIPPQQTNASNPAQQFNATIPQQQVNAPIQQQPLFATIPPQQSNVNVPPQGSNGLTNQQWQQQPNNCYMQYQPLFAMPPPMQHAKPDPIFAKTEMPKITAKNTEQSLDKLEDWSN